MLHPQAQTVQYRFFKRSTLSSAEASFGFGRVGSLEAKLPIHLSHPLGASTEERERLRKPKFARLHRVDRPDRFKTFFRRSRRSGRSYGNQALLQTRTVTAQVLIKRVLMGWGGCL